MLRTDLLDGAAVLPQPVDGVLHVGDLNDGQERCDRDDERRRDAVKYVAHLKSPQT
ncbi:MAG: hypothetical protein HYU55_13060 [Nocardioides sp.]|nr:hypothetical protein [Nocardioides sp.]